MASDGYIDITQKYDRQLQRTKIPTKSDIRYINTSYTNADGQQGINKFPARLPSTTGGWVLPNCTGYSYGRCLETTRLTSLDIAGSASQWFDYNKTKFDAGTGGYPYIQLKSSTPSANLFGWNIGLGYEQLSENAVSAVIMNSLRTGHVICYGEGTSTINGGMVFDDNGHVQTVELLYANQESYDKYLKTRKNVQSFISYLASFLISMGIASLVAKKLTGAAAKLIKDYKMYKYGGNPWQKLVEQWIAQGLWTLEEGLEFLASVENDVYNAYLSKLVSQSVIYIIAVLLSIATGTTIGTLLGEMASIGFPEITISQSSYNGYSESSSIKLWNTDNIKLQNHLNRVKQDTTLQGIIMTPTIDILNPENKDRNFPWQLGNNIGLYD